jgi:hypothetical protein
MTLFGEMFTARVTAWSTIVWTSATISGSGPDGLIAGVGVGVGVGVAVAVGLGVAVGVGVLVGVGVGVGVPDELDAL